MNVSAATALKLIPEPMVNYAKFGLEYLVKERSEALVEMPCSDMRAAPEIPAIEFVPGQRQLGNSVSKRKYLLTEKCVPLLVRC